VILVVVLDLLKFIEMKLNTHILIALCISLYSCNEHNYDGVNSKNNSADNFINSSNNSETSYRFSDNGTLPAGLRFKPFEEYKVAADWKMIDSKLRDVILHYGAKPEYSVSLQHFSCKMLNEYLLEANPDEEVIEAIHYYFNVLAEHENPTWPLLSKSLIILKGKIAEADFKHHKQTLTERSSSWISQMNSHLAELSLKRDEEDSAEGKIAYASQIENAQKSIDEAKDLLKKLK
jgi:hypothetical protein